MVMSLQLVEGDGTFIRHLEADHVPLHAACRYPPQQGRLPAGAVMPRVELERHAAPGGLAQALQGASSGT